MIAKPLPAALCLASLLALGACGSKSEQTAGQSDTPSTAVPTTGVSDSGKAQSTAPTTAAENTTAETAPPKTPEAPSKAETDTAVDPKTGIRSAYTNLKTSSCKTITETNEGTSVTQRCTGQGGVPLIVKAGDLRYDLDAGVEAEFMTPGPFNSVEDTVEWRLGRDGKPFAIIFRIRADPRDGKPGQSWLMVETVGKAGAPGCRIAEVEGATANANVVARAKADAAINGSAKCITG